eukprot:3263556-Alexandrium_andersonii.AAC.1
MVSFPSGCAKIALGALVRGIAPVDLDQLWESCARVRRVDASFREDAAGDVSRWGYRGIAGHEARMWARSIVANP